MAKCALCDYSTPHLKLLIDYLYNCCTYFLTEAGPVGFAAHLSTKLIYRFLDAMTFDLVSANFGNHYNATTSSFSCPRRGIYFFTVSFNTRKRTYSHVRIMRNNEVLAQAFADSTDINDHAQASISVVAECRVNQRVWPQCEADHGCNILTFSTAKQVNVFSGYLLYRLD